MPPVRPLPLLRSLPYFVIPSAITGWIIYRGFDLMLARGFLPLTCFLALALTLVGLFVAALAAYHLEDREWTWSEFRDRLRLGRMARADWGGTVLVAAVHIGTYLGLGFTSAWLEKLLWPMPAVLDKVFSDQPGVFAGVVLKGQWWFAGLYAAVLFFNIFGEELWWRGIIQPRQEAALGRHAWIAQGLLWTLFHLFWAPDLLRILPGALMLAYAVQRRGNTWIGILSHSALNGLGLVGVIKGIMG